MNPTLLSDSTVRFCNCCKVAVQQQVSIFLQSFRIKVSRGEELESVNRKLRDDIGWPLKSRYLKRSYFDISYR